MSDELKPCPFCGSSDIDIDTMPFSDERVLAVCRDCGAFGPPAKRESDATSKWNQRDTGWISVKERLPTKEARYFVYAPSADPANPLIAVAWFHPDDGTWSLLPQMWINAITHWMEPPRPTACVVLEDGRRVLNT